MFMCYRIYRRREFGERP